MHLRPRFSAVANSALHFLPKAVCSCGSRAIFPLPAFIRPGCPVLATRDLGLSFSLLRQQSTGTFRCNFFAVQATCSVRTPGMIEPGLEDINSALGSLITNASSLQSRQQQNLSHVLEWARALNIDPDATFSLHVAGTKGKGSVCAYTEKVLRSAGLKTGLFTSPHLMSVRERFRINGAAIDSEDFKSIFWDVWGRMKQQQQQQQQPQQQQGRDLDSSGALSELPAYFRFLTLLGFAAFKRLDVDVSVIEVGLGGRLDATNIMSAPVACCITSLGMDHMAVLGSTLDKIAFEKAGILKSGVPCVLTPQKPEADAVVVARADVVSCPIYRSAGAFSQSPQLLQLLQQQQPVVAENMTAAVALAALAAVRLPLTTVSKSPRLLEWRQQLELCVPGAQSLASRSDSLEERPRLHVFPPHAPVPDWIITALQVMLTPAPINNLEGTLKVTQVFVMC
jgi:folylpolyglutamate synthase/dihydrofolate synthase